MLHLRLITLGGVKSDEDIYELVVPTTGGEIAINEGHAPLLGAVSPGILKIRSTKQTPDDSRDQFGVYEGTIEVLNDIVTVLVDDVDTPESVSTQDAEAALKRAQVLKDKAGDAISLAEAQSMMDRQAVRLKLADLKKSGKRKY